MLFSSKPSINSAILATLGALSLSISMSLAKQLNPAIPTTLVVFIRTCFGLIFFLPILIANKKVIVKTKKLSLYVVRIVLTVCSMICTYYAYRNLPIAFATSIGMSGPLFTTILSIMLLKEKISFYKWLVIILGYIGVIVVVRPVSFFLDLGTASALLANLLAASAIIIVKILSRYDSTITIMLYTNIGITIVSFLFNIHGWQLLDLKDFILISFMGILGITTQFCSITALKYSSPSFVAPFEYTRIFFAILIGLTVFHEIPDIYTVFGSVAILSSAYMITYLDSKNANITNDEIKK